MQLKDKIEMVGPKSTQTRFVRLITSIIQSSLATLAPLNYHAPILMVTHWFLIESSLHVGEIRLYGWRGGGGGGGWWLFPQLLMQV